MGYTKILGSETAAIEEADRIMSQADMAKTGFIEYTEFIVASSNQATLLSKENLESAFKAFDLTNSGTITTPELKKMLGADHLKEELWQKLIDEVDEDGNGEVDIHEFKDMMLKLI